jgi:uncharacterized membrane protein (DUF2068 family)
MSRFWAAGQPIQVVTDELATPTKVMLDRGVHPIAQVLERWRVDEGWWQRRAWREYFKVLTTTGMLLVVYHDIPRHEWRLQRIYD